MRVRWQSLILGTVLAVMGSSAFSCLPERQGKSEITIAQKQLAQMPLRIGAVEIIAEIARTDAERQSGLMFRTTLDEGKGMLFVYDRDTRMAFWMKNTGIPLSIAFISSEGLIREILDMNAFSLSTTNSEFSVRFALEAPQGWFERAGIKAGDRMIIPSGLVP